MNHPPKRVVRAAQFRQFEQELGQRMTSVLQTYHMKVVEPRLWWLEQPFYKRWWLLCIAAWRLFKTRVRSWRDSTQGPERNTPGEAASAAAHTP